MADRRPTLIRPPPQDESKAPIENALELTELGIIEPDLFTNARELWHPPGARGIYGGAVIAQTLAAAQRTVPADFVIHSYHCFFVLAGDSAVPLLYRVERVRSGRSFATRTVQARQRGACIFTVTCSFVRAGSAAGPAHAVAPPPAAVRGPPPPPDYVEPPFVTDGASASPFESYRCRPEPGDDALPPQDRKMRLWVRARGRISAGGGHQAHCSALAYISDSYFIGTVARAHALWRYPVAPARLHAAPPALRARIAQLNHWEGYPPLDRVARRPRLGMMVSLDHSIYFHNPTRVRADDWMFSEMRSPWAGDGRGVVEQNIWSRDGTLLATCFQEGVVRLKTDDEEKEQTKTDKKAGEKAKL
ncbi:acyl-CoA thioesterase II [Xylariomycetidae sp. FL0641]|nr:acyl-CoA thioesterase II [Xylariomycetidae sp. FL0641]